MIGAAAAIDAHIEKWTKILASTGHDWWPRYVYHFTDVQNAASILSRRAIYSRTRCGSFMQNDNASQGVIANTSVLHKDFVRLYMRPRTPTQYCNEGIRPTTYRYDGAHCPVPVFFCFDARATLNRSDAQCSNGNMGRNDAKCDGTEEFFKSIPFDKVFHNGPLPTKTDPDLAREIKNRRHTEVLIPGELRLDDSLKMIACRSPAERQTLLTLLSEQDQAKWSLRTVVGVDGFFQKDWTYVEAVSIAEEGAVRFQFHPPTVPGISYQLRFEYGIPGRGGQWTWQGTKSDERMGFGIQRALQSGLKNGTVKLFIEDALAFVGRLPFDDKPF